MAAGECWIFDTWREHKVENDASRSRIHLVVDTVGGPAFWDLVDKGRAHDASPGEWTPRHVPPGAAAPPLACERYNIPVVMSPWEVHYRLHGLLDEADQESPLVRSARGLTDAFFRTWRSLWVQFGDSGNGTQHYLDSLYRFLEGIPQPVAQLPLRNGTYWMEGVLSLIGRMAVRR
jgi:hypothetical protein